MAHKKNKRKIQNKPSYPTGVHYTEEDGDFKLHKKFGKTIIKEPFFISDDLSAMIDKIEECRNNWKIALNLKQLKLFINQHTENSKSDEEATISKIYFGQ